MIESKSEFIKQYLPENITNLELSQINLDITDLSVGDILRNINKLYPVNSKNRNAIEDGNMAIGVLCLTDSILPYSGLFIVIARKGMSIDISSSKYMVIVISDEGIINEEAILNTTNKLTTYLVESFSNVLVNLPDFYRKFVYNPYEDDDEYYTSGY